MGQTTHILIFKWSLWVSAILLVTALWWMITWDYHPWPLSRLQLRFTVQPNIIYPQWAFFHWFGDTANPDPTANENHLGDTVPSRCLLVIDWKNMESHENEWVEHLTAFLITKPPFLASSLEGQNRREKYFWKKWRTCRCPYRAYRGAAWRSSSRLWRTSLMCRISAGELETANQGLVCQLILKDMERFL